MVGTIVVAPGLTAADDLSRDCLEIVRFSEFHPKSDTGAFSEEIRLASPSARRWQPSAGQGWQHHGDPLAHALAQVHCSREIVTVGGYHGSQSMRFADLTVAGSSAHTAH